MRPRVEQEHALISTGVIDTNYNAVWRVFKFGKWWGNLGGVFNSDSGRRDGIQT